MENTLNNSSWNGIKLSRKKSRKPSWVSYFIIIMGSNLLFFLLFLNNDPVDAFQTKRLQLQNSSEHIHFNIPLKLLLPLSSNSIVQASLFSPSGRLLAKKVFLDSQGADLSRSAPSSLAEEDTAAMGVYLKVYLRKQDVPRVKRNLDQHNFLKALPYSDNYQFKNKSKGKTYEISF